MIYMNKDKKSLFENRTLVVMEDDNSMRFRLDKFILLQDMTDDERKQLEHEDWDVIYKNGNTMDLRKNNLEIVVFKDNCFSIGS